MIRTGFTLIELVISIAIAAILGVGITLFLSQTGSYQAAVEDRASLYTRASVALHQFEKDISGARVPVENILHEQKMREEKNKKTTNPAQKEAPKPEKGSEKAEAEEAVKPIARVFYVEQKNKQLTTLSCITDNPLKIYWSKSVGSSKPDIARVIYRFVPDPQHDHSFILTRQEGIDLDFNAYDPKNVKAARAYEVIDGIKTCSLRCIVIQPQEESTESEKSDKKTAPEQKKPQPPAPETPPKIIEYEMWDWPSAEKAKKETEKTPETPLPNLISVTLELWDARYERTTEFVYTIPILATPSLDEKSEAEAKKDEEQSAGEPAKSSGKPVPAPSGQPVHSAVHRPPTLQTRYTL
jgi:prepilin-type N-terminal cleavage/methylation domain-containing protein